jgi:hypothetical protein
VKRARWAVALLAVASCGAGNSLEGSLSDEVTLTFDQVQVQRSDTSVAVIYLRSLPAGGGNDTVFKVVANLTGLDATRALDVDLSEALPGSSAVRGSFTRAVTGDARRDFPPLVRGRLHVDGPPDAGKHVSGSFTSLFGQGGTLGAGRTAFGDFTATVTGAGQ